MWSDEDQAWVAVCVELPEATASGDTQHEALRELHTAIELSAASVLDDKLALPAPQPLLMPSGQFRLRIPSSLHFALIERATRDGVSLNTLATSLLAAGVGQDYLMCRK
jgi:antitoxin HicB